MFSAKNLIQRLFVIAGLAIPLVLQGCVNIFDPLDSPSGEAQLLSAARACFDDGDFACAREFYGKLGSNEDAIAELALKRGTGARGLRAIMEHVLLGVMYDIPGREDVEKVVVTAECINSDAQPKLVLRSGDSSKRSKRSEEKSA